ncbi:MAG TPA: alginate export family protein [Acidobacteriaceae bacterium]|nr:alginate export family protein [Acidobacteriaceae bacterium]
MLARPMFKASAGILSALALVSAAAAQSPPPSPGYAGPGSLSGHPVTLSIYERVREENWQWFAAPPTSNTYSYLPSLLRIALSQRVGRWDWQLELSQPAVLGLPSDAVSPVSAKGQLGLGGTYYASSGNNPDPAAAFLKQGFLRYRFGEDKTLRLGRFEFFGGVETHPKDPTVAWLQNNRIQQRLIGNFGFTNGQRSFDGVDAHYGSGAWDVTAMAARADQGVCTMNGNPELNVDAQYLAFTRTAARGRVLARTFAIGYHDGRTGVTKTDNRPLAVRQADHKNIRLGTWGGSLIATQPAGPGTLDFVFWGALQYGAWGSESDRAGGAALEGGYRLTQVPSMPWLRGGWWRGSGDNDPSDNKNTTFFQMLPTPRVYARLPFYNLMNNTDSFVQLIDDPARKLQLRSDLHWINLTSGHDLWYLGGGAYDNKVFGFTGRPANGDTSLASVADISSDWQTTSHLAVNLYYGYGWGKRAVSAIYPTGSNIQFGYAELVWRWGLTSRTGMSH